MIVTLTVEMVRLNPRHRHMLTGAVPLLYHEQLAVFHKHILNVVLGIDSDRRIVGSLPVVVDHEVVNEGLGLVVSEQIGNVRHPAEVVIDLMAVDCACSLHSLAAGALGTCCEGMGGEEDEAE